MNLSFQRLMSASLLLLLLASCRNTPLKNHNTIQKFLSDRGYQYSKDPEGDFRITLELEDKSTSAVWIRTDLNYTGEEAVREIFSIGGLLDDGQTSYLSSYLLQDNFHTRVMGSWAYINDNQAGKTILIYLMKLPLSTDSAFLQEALHEAAFAADVMDSVINSGN